jgi:adenylate cyclase
MMIYTAMVSIIAARLEALAEPGGICISGMVYDALGNKLPICYEALGEQYVKNIAQPVRAYRAHLTAASDDAKAAVPPQHRFRKWMPVAAIALAIFVA